MSNAVENFDWRGAYQDSLGTEILRSERRRVTILSGLFVFAACVYTFLTFVPGAITPEFQVRFQAQWPWFISLYGAVAAYEWSLRAGIGWLIEHRRQPNIALRFVNAFIETSIPTVMLFMAVSLMGPRDALGSPAFLLYFFFILLFDTSTGRSAVPLYRPGCGRGAFYFCPSCHRSGGSRRAGVILANAGF